MSDPIEVLDFWLGDVGPEGWYAGGEALDAEIQHRFGDLWLAAKAGGLEHWVEGTVGTLAYLILCDQMARNMHRGAADAFATDAQARAAALKALEAGWDLQAPEPERQFFYMPFEHSEQPEDQARAVDLLTSRLSSVPELAIHALAHQAIIARFGRFPFRNAALGRQTTPEEAEFLENGGYAAEVNAIRASHASGA